MKRFLLDRQGCTQLPEGYRVVTTEKEFLQEVRDGAALVIRGEALCRWAEAFFCGRGWKFDYTKSPIEALRTLCPELSEDQAWKLAQALGASFDPLKQLEAADVLELLFPEFQWHQPTSPPHAARWLMWLDDTSISDFIVPLLSHQSNVWTNECDEPIRPIYSIHKGAEAEQMLTSWLGLNSESKVTDFGVFSEPVPEKWIKRARGRWSLLLVENAKKLFEALRYKAIPHQMREAAALEASQYFSHHPDKLSPSVIRFLEPYLPASALGRLWALAPPPDPGDVPKRVEEVLDWFTDRYIDYRKWEAENGDDSAHERISSLALSFADWYLSFYPSALNGGPGKELLVMTHSSRFKSEIDNDSVTLWVILDGLPYTDAQTLIRYVQETSTRISVAKQIPLLNPLPTITKFCKPSLRLGIPPTLALDATNQTFLGKEIPNHKDAAAILKQAEKGNIFTWILREPDDTYHKQGDKAATLRRVESVLRYLAKGIVDAALAVPDHLPVRVILSTDHGRLLDISKRQHPVPTDMETHGRAAYGSSTIDFDHSGVYRDGSIAYLDPQRFGLPVVCAVVLDGSSFLTNDNKMGVESFPHGGIYPEEVIVPWVELIRDAQILNLTCKVNGKSKAGTSGVLLINVTNPNTVPFTAISMQLKLGDQDTRLLKFDVPIAAYSSSTFDISLDGWPTKRQTENAEAVMTLLRPDRQQFDCPVLVEIESEEMYTRELDIEDLL